MRLVIEAVEVLHQPNFLTDTRDNPQMIQTFHRKIRHADPFQDDVARVSHASWAPVKSSPSRNRSPQQRDVRKMG